MNPPRMNKTQVKYFHYMTDAMQRLEWDMHNAIYRAERIPPMWREIAKEKGRDKKIKITIGVEAGIVRFFKSMGSGYQNRMNDVMSAWMHGRLAGVIEGAETMDAFKFQMCAEDPKWEWGGTEEAMRGIGDE